MIELQSEFSLARRAGTELLARVAEAKNRIKVIRLECDAHALLWRLEMAGFLSSHDADNFRVLLQVRLEKRLSQFRTL
jgi:hypothetical protein